MFESRALESSRLWDLEVNSEVRLRNSPVIQRLRVVARVSFRFG